MIKVLKPGLDTSVQDQGRNGYYASAYPPSGALDMFSYTVANVLVGNDKIASAIEFTFLGPELEFQENTVIAVTGGEIPPKLNGEPIPMWTNVPVKEGDVLSFDFVKSGARTYVAVRGGIEVPLVLGSRSTYTLAGIGGFKGRTLKDGDILTIGKMYNSDLNPGFRVPSTCIPQFSKYHEIRTLVGLAHYRFPEESKERFFNMEWTVTTEANRMGYRLKGDRLDFVQREQPFGAGDDPSNVVDMGNPPGAIQVPGGMELIVVFKDVTTSGFATIGTVINADLNHMAQIKPNEKIKFIPVSLDEAIQARKDIRNKILKIEEQIRSN